MSLLVLLALALSSSASDREAANLDAEADPCSSIPGQLGLFCEDFWFNLPTNVESAINSPALADWLCNHPCLQPSIDAASSFVSEKCPGYMQISYAVAFVTNFGCLVDDKTTPQQFCIGEAGGVIAALSTAPAIDASVCSVVSATGCCFGSFIDVEIAIINLNFAPFMIIPVLRAISTNCTALGFTVNTDSCSGGQHDPCQQPFDAYPADCFIYSANFSSFVFEAMQSQALSADLCNSTCLAPTIKLMNTLVQHRKWVTLYSQPRSLQPRLLDCSGHHVANAPVHNKLSHEHGLQHERGRGLLHGGCLRPLCPPRP